MVLNKSIVSQRVNRIKPSPTLQVSALAAKMRSEGIDVLSLSAGEPDFDTPDHIKQAAIKAIEDGHTKYTAVGGLPELKKIIVDKFQQQNNLSYTTDEIIVSSGAKHSIYNFLQAVVDPADEVLIPTPYWVSYPDMALIMDGKPVFVNPDQGSHKITGANLKEKLTDKSKVLILNSPSNPSGAVYSKKELKDLGRVIAEHPNLLVVSDDIYEHICWSEQGFTNILNVCPELKERVVIVNGVSKSYAMTGWRIGYAAGPTAIIKAMSKLQSQATSNPCSISQHASIAALKTSMQEVASFNAVYRKRHDIVYTLLSNIKGIKPYRAEGSFYSFADFTEMQHHLKFDEDVALSGHILQEARVALVPGSAFGMPGYMRLSYATSEDIIRSAIERIASLVE